MRKQRVGRDARASKRGGGVLQKIKESFLSSHVTFPFLPHHLSFLLLLARTVSLLCPSLIKGKGGVLFPEGKGGLLRRKESMVQVREEGET